MRWVGYAAFATLYVALAMTYSRTGVVVMGLEMVAWGVICGRDTTRPSRCGRNELRPSRVAAGVVAVVALAAVAWWMRGRMSLDGAVMNRPKIWLAGLQLFASNPLGVGFGCSGEIASAFLLPDGVAVRTLVNSHLTLLVETGALIGGAWLAFIAAALSLASAWLESLLDGGCVCAYGEDDTRQIASRDGIDPEFRNPFRSARLMALWLK